MPRVIHTAQALVDAVMEVPSLPVRGGNVMATSQLALPEDVCDLVYATDGYEQSVENKARTSLDSDMVFSDGVDQQLADVNGDVDSGYTATLALALSR